MKLTRRLQQIADLVKHPVGILADVGTDHGLIPIYLAKRFPEREIYGLDLRERPLFRAAANADSYGVRERVHFLQSDGLTACLDKKLTTLIITGMGGILMDMILQNGAACLTEQTELILSPHADRHLVRRRLHRLGYRIRQEYYLKEAGKYYAIIYADWGQDEPYSESEYYFGKTEKTNDKEMLRELRQLELQELTVIWQNLNDAPTENGAAVQKKAETEKQIADLEALLQIEEERIDQKRRKK